jgi:hypothetical protein
MKHQIKNIYEGGKGGCENVKISVTINTLCDNLYE